MLIVSIHGFRPKLTLWEHIPFFGQFFSPKPDIWRTAERFMARCKELARDSPVHLIRLGYKDIVYKSYKRWFFRDRGREKTIALIKQSYIKFPGRIVIFGHSLGGWGANILASELLRDEDLSSLLETNEGGKLALIQVDALPLTARSRLITQEWVTEDGKDLLNQVFDFIADLLDDIDKKPIYPKYLERTKSGVLRHKKTYKASQVFAHLNFYCKEESWDSSNQIVHFATQETVSPIDSEAENLTNIGVNASHIEIDKSKHILSKLPEDLCS